jgi:hypothetical protein
VTRTGATAAWLIALAVVLVCTLRDSRRFGWSKVSLACSGWLLCAALAEFRRRLVSLELVQADLGLALLYATAVLATAGHPMVLLSGLLEAGDLSSREQKPAERTLIILSVLLTGYAIVFA